MSALVHYEEMRVAVQTCARIDEAADMLDKAAALAAYARQQKDTELDVWMTEIRRRAEIRIGELSRELDRSSGGANPLSTLPTSGKSKADALFDAGISTSTAHRYEELTGGADARGEAAAKRAIEETLARGRAERTPVSAKELRSAIKEAILAELGPAPERRARHWRITNRTPDARVTPLVTATLSASSLQSEHQARARARTVPML